MSPRDALALLLLGALWGGSFLFIRIGAPALGPVLLIELRVLIAGLALLGFAALRRRLPELGKDWHRYLIAGAINSALPFVLISAAEIQLPASFAATLNATTPLFGALVAAWWLGEALTARKVMGLVVGFLGVVLLVGLSPLPLNLTTLVSIGASLLAAFCYGMGAVYIKRQIPAGRPQALATWSQLFSALLLLPIVPFVLPSAVPSTTVLGSVLALALLCTAVAYLLYFHLIRSVGPTKAVMVTYLAPAFGMLWGALFLREQLGAATFLGFGLILASVALVSRAPAAKSAAVR
jgi:drug/metabolite transporter (DMT)-like permease